MISRSDVSCDGGNIFMANTFTPNGDGNNDIFFPQTPGKDIIKVFRVYNRWGQMLHEELTSSLTTLNMDGMAPMKEKCFRLMYMYIS